MKLPKSKLLKQTNKDGDVVVRPTRHLLTVFAFMGEDHKTKSKFDLMYIGILLLLCGKLQYRDVISSVSSFTVAI